MMAIEGVQAVILFVLVLKSNLSGHKPMILLALKCKCDLRNDCVHWTRSCHAEGIKTKSIPCSLPALDVHVDKGSGRQGSESLLQSPISIDHGDSVPSRPEHLAEDRSCAVPLLFSLERGGAPTAHAGHKHQECALRLCT